MKPVFKTLPSEGVFSDCHLPEFMTAVLKNLPSEVGLFAQQALGFASLAMHSRWSKEEPGMQKYYTLAFEMGPNRIWNAVLELHGFASLTMHPIWSCTPAAMPQASEASPTLPRVGEMTQVFHTFHHAISHIMNLLKLKHPHWQKYTNNL